MNRPLDENEAFVLHLVLDDLQDAALLEQERSVTVSGGKPTFVDFAVPSSAPRSSVDNGPLKITPNAVTQEGDPAGVILVWVDDGRLSAMEYGWYTDETPVGFPAPALVSLGYSSL